jgi:hypothetical protein
MRCFSISYVISLKLLASQKGYFKKCQCSLNDGEDLIIKLFDLKIFKSIISKIRENLRIEQHVRAIRIVQLKDI